jgi:hypothetical protein
MKKKFVFWIAKVLGVQIFEKETVEMVNKPYNPNLVRFDVIESYPIKFIGGEVVGIARHDFSMRIAEQILNQKLYVFEEYEEPYNRTINCKMTVVIEKPETK